MIPEALLSMTHYVSYKWVTGTKLKTPITKREFSVLTCGAIGSSVRKAAGACRYKAAV